MKKLDYFIMNEIVCIRNSWTIKIIIISQLVMIGAYFLTGCKTLEVAKARDLYHLETRRNLKGII